MKKIFQTALLLAVILSLQFGAVVHAQQSTDVLRFETSLTIVNQGETVMQYARVFVPLITQMTRYGEVTNETYNITPEEITEGEDGQRMGTFYINPLAPGQQANLTITYEITSALESPSMTNQTVSDNSVIQPPEIVATARRLTGHLNTDEEKIAALIRFTHHHIRYDLDSPWRHTDALTTLYRAEGVCEDYASLLVALAGASGIESRIVYGYYRSPASGDWIRHAWVQYRLEDENWESVDPTIHSGFGLNPDAVYLAQWYEDQPTRIRFAGGRLAASMSESITRIR